MVLASASPRRAELLRQQGWTFKVVPSNIPEPPFLAGDPVEYAKSLATAKAQAVPGEVVVGADTIVVLDGEVLGKPANSIAAVEMLKRLSGRTHQVITAVAVRRGDELHCDYASSKVSMRSLSELEIQEYVDSGEPLDKAGSYAIQGKASAFVELLEGQLDTVIGLPIILLRQLL